MQGTLSPSTLSLMMSIHRCRPNIITARIEKLSVVQVLALLHLVPLVFQKFGPLLEGHGIAHG